MVALTTPTGNPGARVIPAEPTRPLRITPRAAERPRHAVRKPAARCYRARLAAMRQDSPPTAVVVPNAFGDPVEVPVMWRDFENDAASTDPKQWRDAKAVLKRSGGFGLAALLNDIEDTAAYEPVNTPMMWDNPTGLLAIALHAYLSATPAGRRRMAEKFNRWLLRQ